MVDVALGILIEVKSVSFLESRAQKLHGQNQPGPWSVSQERLPWALLLSQPCGVCALQDDPLGPVPSRCVCEGPCTLLCLGVPVCVCRAHASRLSRPQTGSGGETPLLNQMPQQFPGFLK